jgi:hypothetical protein
MEILRLGKWGVQDYVGCRLDTCRNIAFKLKIPHRGRLNFEV